MYQLTEDQLTNMIARALKMAQNGSGTNELSLSSPDEWLVFLSSNKFESPYAQCFVFPLCFFALFRILCSGSLNSIIDKPNELPATTTTTTTPPNSIVENKMGDGNNAVEPPSTTDNGKTNTDDVSGKKFNRRKRSSSAIKKEKMRTPVATRSRILNKDMVKFKPPKMSPKASNKPNFKLPPKVKGKKKMVPNNKHSNGSSSSSSEMSVKVDVTPSSASSSNNELQLENNLVSDPSHASKDVCPTEVRRRLRSSDENKKN